MAILGLDIAVKEIDLSVKTEGGLFCFNCLCIAVQQLI